jgi:hypothetical protein
VINKNIDIYEIKVIIEKLVDTNIQIINQRYFMIRKMSQKVKARMCYYLSKI